MGPKCILFGYMDPLGFGVRLRGVQKGFVGFVRVLWIVAPVLAFEFGFQGFLAFYHGLWGCRVSGSSGFEVSAGGSLDFGASLGVT